MEDQKYLFHLWWFSDRPFQNLGLVDPGCCESCHVFSFLPFIPSELVHWATKHLSRVLNSNNPNLIFSPWLSLVTPETADQSERSGTNLQKTEPIIKRELHGQARCKGYGEDSSGGGPGLSCPLIGSPALLGMVIGWCVDIGNWAIWAT